MAANIIQANLFTTGGISIGTVPPSVAPVGNIIDFDPSHPGNQIMGWINNTTLAFGTNASMGEDGQIFVINGSVTPQVTGVFNEGPGICILQSRGGACGISEGISNSEVLATSMGVDVIVRSNDINITDEDNDNLISLNVAGITIKPLGDGGMPNQHLITDGAGNVSWSNALLERVEAIEKHLKIIPPMPPKPLKSPNKIVLEFVKTKYKIMNRWCELTQIKKKQ
jgi:hypothetical protein